MSKTMRMFQQLSTSLLNMQRARESGRLTM